MQGKNSTKPRAVRTAADVKAAQKSLAEATERLRIRNLQLDAYLRSAGVDPVERVANSPDVPLEDATERYSKFLDEIDARRSSVPPPPPKKR